MNLSIKNRIALYYMLSTATVVILVFFMIYFIVSATVYYHLNNDLDYEVDKHRSELTILNDTLSFKDEVEWLEREHRTIEVNPVFVQVIDDKGHLITKSPNLKEGNLVYLPSQEEDKFYNTKLSGKAIRQIQVSISKNDKSYGYLLVAMSMEDSQMVLSNLKRILLTALPVVLIILFLVARLIVSRSIRPIIDVIDTANLITRENLSQRISIPINKDELHTLVVTINDLLDRIENAVKREKQFTSDASHELRTPLAILKGTLEVLIRKPRRTEEYLEKIEYSILEINRMNHLVDQLLLLARFDGQLEALENKVFDLVELIENVLSRLQFTISEKHLKIDISVPYAIQITSDPYLVDIIIENLLSNAIKYSKTGGVISLSLHDFNGQVICEIRDQGIGIREEELSKIFERFYRSDALIYPKTKGNGLGLSIVKRLCDLLGITISLQSQYGVGTTVSLNFTSKHL